LDKPKNIPIANQTVRLEMYQKLITKNKSPAMALKILRQAAQEIGGQFTNRQEITGKDGKPIETVNSSISTESYLKAREQVLDEY